ncbi:hypothetical protein FV232_25055 [Methylobacterium sp. WL30]|uniref:ribbon-helix-helix domain-containing protein n=1 Tax=unclassified Methylobacterium TaxID=2615210 RepID=UPI0011C8546B|nr:MULTISPECIES: ribbon-helix-helix domain-containing protein [unclassified Methylobacterium]TXN27893.1 hypothetical protein FV225_21385 [Methylobacterium sp. WL93]TXN45663.1 hypothetical protein FV227_24735 [Methylobacterium sp. WL119]TXN62618.1 hypothetical protein FV232_25055 [Methylobacterium sp. WL30]
MARNRPASLEAALSSALPQESTAGTDTIVQHPATPMSAQVPKARNYEQVVAYVPTACKKRLRMMCIEHDRDLNSFIREGIDLMLAKYGQPSLKEFEAKL